MDIISKVNGSNRFSNHSDIYCEEADNRIPVQTIEILARCFLIRFTLWL